MSDIDEKHLMPGKQLLDKQTGAICTVVGYEYEENEIFKDDENGYPLSVPVKTILLQFGVNVNNGGVPLSREFEPYPPHKDSDVQNT